MVTLLKWTVPDYHHLIEQGLLDGKKVELLDGDLVTMAPEGPLHSYTTTTVADYLRQNLHGLALVREAHPITLSQSEPEPDIAIVLAPQERYKERHPQADDIFWLIEIANSTQAYDLNDKKTNLRSRRHPRILGGRPKQTPIIYFSSTRQRRLSPATNPLRRYHP